MGRPILKRTAKSYRRDCEALSRLRLALQQDTALPPKDVERVCGVIDELTKALITFAAHIDESAA